MLLVNGPIVSHSFLHLALAVACVVTVEYGPPGTGLADNLHHPPVTSPDRGEDPRAVPVPSRIRLNGKVMEARALKQPLPDYPAEECSEKRSGLVALEVVIARDGKVKSVTPASGEKPFYASARRAVEKWVYKPTLINGQAVEVETKVEVRYRAGPFAAN